MRRACVQPERGLAAGARRRTRLAGLRAVSAAASGPDLLAPLRGLLLPSNLKVPPACVVTKEDLIAEVAELNLVLGEQLGKGRCV